MNITTEVAVIGAGLVGLCCGLEIAATNEVLVLSAGEDGKASNAAAGMLAPACEWDPWMSGDFVDLLRRGREYYPVFLERLGIRPAEVGYAPRDFLLLDLLENDGDLSGRMRGMRASGANVEYVDARAATAIEPGLNADAIRGLVRVSEDSVVNPRALQRRILDALPASCRVIPARALGAKTEGASIELATTAGTVRAERVVIAAGAWSYEIGQMLGVDVPTSPVKGQMVELRGAPGLIASIVYMPAGGCGCLLERSPGVYIAGTSEEATSPTLGNTSRVIGAILSRINRVFHFAGQLEVADMWAGFRPITPDELPIIGVSSDPRIIVATGHHRNGVLLAPLTGRIVARVLDGTTHELGFSIAPYHPDRPLRPQYPLASAY